MSDVLYHAHVFKRHHSAWCSTVAAPVLKLADKMRNETDTLWGQTLFVQTAAICSRASKILVGILTGEQYNVATAPGWHVLAGSDDKWETVIHTQSNSYSHVKVRIIWKFHLGSVCVERKRVQLAVSDILHKFVLNCGTLHSFGY